LNGAAAFTPDPSAFSLGSTERSRWQTFTSGTSPLVGKEVLAIAEDRQGRIWLGTENGVSVLDESGGSARWQHFTADSSDGSRSLPHRRVQALAVDGDGRVWAGTKDGLASYDPARSQEGWRTYRSHPLRRLTGLIFPPHAWSDVIADEITALAWVR
jgi:outer membrane protein assembly factor BamB